MIIKEPVLQVLKSKNNGRTGFLKRGGRIPKICRGSIQKTIKRKEHKKFLS